jgi:capsid protein
MLHVYRPEFAQQGRGFSLDAHLIQDNELLADFTLAHIKKAINQASTTLYVKPSQDKPASNPYETIVGKYSRPTAGTALLSGDTSVSTSNEEYVNFYDLPEASMTRPGSVGVFGLNSGEDLKTFDQSTPIESYPQFVDSFLAHLAASRGMPIEVLLMRFNQNYSASRATLKLFWRIAMMWRDNLAADMLDIIYEMWLAEEIAAGRITARGWSDPRIKAAWLAGRWVGTPMPDIDPLRSSKADKNWAELGAKHLDEVAIERGGYSSSGKVNRAKLTRQYEELPTPPWSNKQSDTGGTADGEPQ